MRSARAGAILVASLLVGVVFAGCMGEGQPERHPQMEGLEDGWEIQVTMLGGAQETRRVFPSERGMDHDADGLDDYQEYLQGTDPNDPDTSGNGLLDGENVVLGPEDPRAFDWRERGIAYFELDDGRLEFQGAWDWRVNPTKQDSAGNGIMDGDEVKGLEVWTLGERRVIQTDPLRYDTSGEGFSDREKRDMGLDPIVRDTDGDGVQDASDVNPWIDFQIRLEVVSVDLLQARTMWLILQVSDVRFESPPTGLPAGHSSEPGLSSGVLSPSDEGGDLRRGQHNMTFVLTAVTSGPQGPERLDLFSDTAGSENFFGAIHALTGANVYSKGGPGAWVEPWPPDATFSGAHGDITFRLVPVWPEAWQRCIDEGCRHGEGEFPWR